MSDIDQLWQRDLTNRIDKLEDGINDITMRTTLLEKQLAVDEVHRENVEKRLTSIEDYLRWIVRMIIGAIVMGVIGFIIGGGIATV